LQLSSAKAAAGPVPLPPLACAWWIRQNPRVDIEVIAALQ